MKPVDQTRTGYPDGNCFHACVASLLELPIEGVPDIPTIADDWWQQWQAWLEPRNLQLFGWAIGDENAAPRGYAILGVLLPGLGIGHAVVAKGGLIVHDPHHFEVELRSEWEWQHWIVLAPLDVARPVDTSL